MLPFQSQKGIRYIKPRVLLCLLPATLFSLWCKVCDHHENEKPAKSLLSTLKCFSVHSILVSTKWIPHLHLRESLKSTFFSWRKIFCELVPIYFQDLDQHSICFPPAANCVEDKSRGNSIFRQRRKIKVFADTRVLPFTSEKIMLNSKHKVS